MKAMRGVRCGLAVVGLTVCGIVGVRSAFAAPIYLRADSPGGADGATFDGASWSTAYNAVADAMEALNASTDAQPTLKIAQGVYPMTAAQTVSVANFVIRGGYRAQDDGDETRDARAYQTILNGYGSNAQTWTRYDPIAGTTTHLTDKVLVDGKIHYPEEAGDNAPNAYTLFYRRIDTWGYEGDFLTVASTAGGEVSGLVVIGCKKKTAIVIAGGGLGTVVSNCLFTANGYNCAVSMGVTDVPSRVTDCVFKFNLGTGNQAMGVYFSGVGVLDNSTFDGNYVNDGFKVSLVDFNAAGGVVSNCVFNRTCYIATHNNRAGSYEGAAAVIRPRNNNPSVYDCVIANTFTKSTEANPNPAPVVNGRTGLYSGIVVSNGLSQVYVTGGRSYSVFSDPANGANGAIWTNCVFRGNTLSVLGKTTTGYVDGDVAVGTLSNAKDGYALKVYDTVFDSNTIELPEDDDALSGLNVVRCRGVVSQGITGTAASQVTVDHCTFIGPTEDGVYDIAQFGVAHTKPFTVQNSIFQLTDESLYSTPFLAQCPVYNNKVLFAPLDVTIQNQTVQPASYAIAGLASDKVPLNADYEPLARTPEILTTTDGRPRGARPLAAGVAEKKTLTVRREPLEGGAITAGGTQAVASGEEIADVTAEPVAGSSFAGWFYDGESTPVSTDLTLSGERLASDRVIIAKFTTRAVRVVYDLDGKGTFVATGTDRYAIDTNAGLDFPSCEAAFTIADGWIFVKWLDVPSKVPSDVSEFVVSAKIVTTGLRTVYLTPTGAGRMDGTSWENAYADLQTAIDDAAICQGEVWAKEGVYTMPLKTDLRDNVALRGGFAGYETSADEADPSVHETIFTGDLALGDYWTTNDVRVANIIADGKIVLPGGDGDDPSALWRHVFVTTPTGIGFTDELAESPLTNVCFSGVTIANFNTKAVLLGSGTKAVFDDCRFVANCCDSEMKADYMTLSSAGQVALRNCRFTGNYAAVSLSAGKTCTNLIAGCTFEHGRSVYATCGVGISGAARTIVTNCVFRRNCAVGNNFYSAPASALGVDKSVDADLRVLDTLFAKNRAEGTAIATVMIRNGHNVVTFERCRFVENSYRTTAAMPTGYNMEYLPGSSGISSLSDRAVTICDSAFETNTVYVKIASSDLAKVYNNYASAIGIGFAGSVRVMNVVFAGNRATDESDGALPYPVGTLSTGYNGGGAALAVMNSLFRDNVVVSSRSYAEIALVGSATETVALLNDVLWNASASYRPFSFDTAITPQLWSCIVKNFDSAVFADGDPYSYCEKVSTEDPVFSPKCRFRLGATTTGSHGGVRIYPAASGKWYFKDAQHSPSKPWRNVVDRKSLSETVADLADEPLPDMEGASRARRVSYGPLAAETAGFILFVR